MTELEQLRKEVNELRERVAKLEARPDPLAPHAPAPMPGVLPWPPPVARPYWVGPPYTPSDWPPGTIVCGSTSNGSAQ